MRTTPHRTVVDPSPADLPTERAAYDAVIRGWTAASTQNRKLTDKLTAAIAALRRNGNRKIEIPDEPYRSN